MGYWFLLTINNEKGAVDGQQMSTVPWFISQNYIGNKRPTCLHVTGYEPKDYASLGMGFPPQHPTDRLSSAAES